MIELKDFVAHTIQEIYLGIAQAERSLGHQVLAKEASLIQKTSSAKSILHLDLEVESRENDSKGFSIGVASVFKAEGSVSGGTNQTAKSRIAFDIPLLLS